MSQRLTRASTATTTWAVASSKKDKQVRGLSQSPSKAKRSSTKKNKKKTHMHTRRRSVVGVIDVAMVNNVPLVDWTTSQLYQHIIVMLDSNPLNDQIIREYLWRLGGDRSLLEQHFDLLSLNVLETSVIATQLKDYVMRVFQRNKAFRSLGDYTREYWIASSLTVRFNMGDNRAIDPPSTAYAALFDDLRFLQWLTEHGYPKHTDTTCMAAQGGSLDCLKYATEQGFLKHRQTTVEAAESGHLDCLKYAVEHGFEKHVYTTGFAAAGGHLDCLTYATEQSFKKDPIATVEAAAGGHLDCLKYATEQGFEKHTDTTMKAAAGGHLDCLKYATEQGFLKHRDTTMESAKSGHLDCLKYATERGFEKNPYTTAEAAEGGHLDCLKYATEQGFEKDSETTGEAAAGGHLDCLKYATEQGFEKDPRTTMQAAAGGYLECLKYATEQGFVKHRDTTTQAARFGHLDCLIYATEHGYFKNPHAMLVDMNQECLQYMIAMHWPSPEDLEMDYEDEDDGNQDNNGDEDETEQRREAVPSFEFPSAWNDFPKSRIVKINIEVPMEGFSFADMDVITKQRLGQLFGETCYNVMEADDVSMQDYLDEHKRNHVVTLMPQQQRARSDSANGTRVLRPAEAMTRDQLVNQMADLSAQFYPCVGRNGTFPVDKSVRFIKLPLSSNLYIPASDLDAMLSVTHSNKQIWELTDSGLDIGTMASGSATDAQNYVSAHHCQSGTGRRIYRLSAIDVNVFYIPRASSTAAVDSSSSHSSSRRPRPLASNSNNNNNSKRSVKKSKTAQRDQ